MSGIGGLQRSQSAYEKPNWGLKNKLRLIVSEFLPSFFTGGASSLATSLALNTLFPGSGYLNYLRYPLGTLAGLLGSSGGAKILEKSHIFAPTPDRERPEFLAGIARFLGSSVGSLGMPLGESIVKGMADAVIKKIEGPNYGAVVPYRPLHDATDILPSSVRPAIASKVEAILQTHGNSPGTNKLLEKIIPYVAYKKDSDTDVDAVNRFAEDLRPISKHHIDELKSKNSHYDPFGGQEEAFRKYLVDVVKKVPHWENAVNKNWIDTAMDALRSGNTFRMEPTLNRIKLGEKPKFLRFRRHNLVRIGHRDLMYDFPKPVSDIINEAVSTAKDKFNYHAQPSLKWNKGSELEMIKQLFPEFTPRSVYNSVTRDEPQTMHYFPYGYKVAGAVTPNTPWGLSPNRKWLTSPRLR